MAESLVIQKNNREKRDLVRAAFKSACVAELKALKPGNVHIFSNGHGMTMEDFMISAKVAAEEISATKSSLGQRIFNSVSKTIKQVGCNTNLGIILLCAPISQVIMTRKGMVSTKNIQNSLNRLLKNLSIEDTKLAYQAIRLASPGGIGKKDKHDVQQDPDVELLKAMQYAEKYDRIAYQYTHKFKDIFDFGVPIIKKKLGEKLGLRWAATAVYIAFLARFADTHIVRKFSKKIALNVLQQAKKIEKLIKKGKKPEEITQKLIEFDKKLKKNGINPGTSADLTVASLFVTLLQEFKD